MKTIPSRKKNKISHFDTFGWFILICLCVITYATCPSKSIVDRASLAQVWYYGWITAVSTGLGVVPFFFFPEPDKYYMGISNAIASGMMITASCSLFYEGATFDEITTVYGMSPLALTFIGSMGGVLFILLTKQILSQYEHLKLGDVQGVSAQKMVLIIFVMTLHSLTEGIGIGVSFGGKNGHQLGQFISLSLAVHNIPEGLAVVLVLTSRSVSRLRAALWAVLTSLPQPLMAIPAFIFIEKAIFFLPSGLGFAAGSMAYVAIFELLLEAIEDTSIVTSAVVGLIACGSMVVAQMFVKFNI